LLKGISMIHKWPDGTPKSMHTAFNWRENALGILCAKPTPTPARATDLTAADSIYTLPKNKNITKFTTTKKAKP